MGLDIIGREFLIKNSIEFPDYLRYQDPPFLVKALISADRFWVLPVELYCYRFGHQDVRANDRKIVYTLMGIRDNIQIALQYGYDELLHRLIEMRLDDEFFESIMSNLSEDVIQLLESIVELGRKYNRKINLKALDCLPRYQQYCELCKMEDALEELNNIRNQSFGIFRKTALLKTQGVDFSDILQWMGFNEIYVYGFGEIGQMLLKSVQGIISVKNILDTAMMDRIDISKDDLPIIVTPGAAFQEISYGLIKKGIKRERIYAIHTLLTLALKYHPAVNLKSTHLIKAKEKLPGFAKQKQFLLVGTDFENKEAQALLFAAVSEIRRRYSEAVIWYYPAGAEEEYPRHIQDKYDFLFLSDGISLRAQLYEIITQVDAIINIADHSMAEFWENEWFMRILRISGKYGIPLYLMPQSFGPFDFSEEKQGELKQYLPRITHIFAREQSEFEQMKKIYGLNNISLSEDLVLQNRKTEKEYIYMEDHGDRNILDIDAQNNVAVIPYIRNREFGSKKKLLEAYQKIVLRLLEKGKNVYIVPYSDNLTACNDICNHFTDNARVRLIDENFDAIEFEELIKKFQYTIASCFHAIVQGYKNGIPCIAIGWADKYVDLLNLFQQGEYLIDVREELDTERILELLEKMDSVYTIETDRIMQLLPVAQKENCFDVLQ